MATISEDYVSFEVAKLLKDKGFNESCYTYYNYIDDTINRFDKEYHFNNKSFPWGIPYGVSKAKKYIVAPTLQMAMKWLREVHNLHIVVFRYDNSAFPYIWYIFAHNGDKPHKANSYEEACEAAIKYCLENLI